MIPKTVTILDHVFEHFITTFGNNFGSQMLLKWPKMAPRSPQEPPQGATGTPQGATKVLLCHPEAHFWAFWEPRSSFWSLLGAFWEPNSPKMNCWLSILGALWSHCGRVSNPSTCFQDCLKASKPRRGLASKRPRRVPRSANNLVIKSSDRFSDRFSDQFYWFKFYIRST